MKTLGIIGGIAPGSTIDYYRSIIAVYRERKGDGSYPPILINSIDLKKMLDLIGAQKLTELADYLLGEVVKLARAGAEVGLLASNAPHIVFDEIRRQSPIPLISIVEATCQAARALALTRVGLIGARFTMQGRFYPEVFSQQGIMIVTPNADDQDYVHNKYMGELVNGLFRDETQQGLLGVVERMRAREGIQGLILGGTELPLILRDVADIGIPFLDTARIHVEQAVTYMLSDEAEAGYKIL